MDVQKIIHDQVTSNPVGGNERVALSMPRCGFSANATQILRACGVTEFVAVDVLADEAIRQGIKEYASWPTIPQLYIKGEFVGGSDIMREMYESGELKKLLDGAA